MFHHRSYKARSESLPGNLLPLRSSHAGLIGTAQCALLLATALAYWRGLSGPFLLDDFPQLEPLFTLDVNTWPAWVRNYLFSGSGPLGRPVAMATFIANAATFGNDIWYWKYTNLLTHMLTALVIFWFTGRLAQTLPRMPPSRAWTLALAVSALWLLHPLQVSTVLYTVQRMTQLAALFTLLGLLSYVLGRERQVSGKPGGTTWLIAVAFGVWFPLAAFSKETGLLFPLFALLIEILVFRFQGNRKTRRLLIALFVVFLAIPALVAATAPLTALDRWLLAGYSARDFTLYERVLTEMRVLAYYLYQLLVPIQKHMGFFHDDFTVSKGWLEPPSTLASLALLSAVMFLAWRLRRRAPLATLGIGLFFAAHLLESTVLPLEIMFEHRNYLASFGVFLAVSDGIRHAGGNKPLLAGIAGLALIALTTLTWQRAETWSSEQKMYTYDFYAHPNSKTLNIIFANNLANAGHYRQAEALLAEHDQPGFALNRLYIECLEKKTLTEAEVADTLEKMRGVIGIYELSGLVHLANLGLDGKCNFSPNLYLKLLERALHMPMPDTGAEQKLLIYKAHYLHREHDEDGAIAALDKSRQAVINDPVPLFLATEWSIDSGKLVEARKYYAHALAVARETGMNYSEFIARIDRRLAKGARE